LRVYTKKFDSYLHYLIKVAAEVTRKTQPTGSASSGTTRVKSSSGKGLNKKMDRQQINDVDSHKQQNSSTEVLSLDSDIAVLIICICLAA
jgi:hypothetical protein